MALTYEHARGAGHTAGNNRQAGLRLGPRARDGADVDEIEVRAQAYDAAPAFDRAEEARYAARSDAHALAELLATLPDRHGALDIGTGEGAFLAELLKLGFTGAPINRGLGMGSPIIDIEHMQLFSLRSVDAAAARRLREVAHRPITNRYPIRYWARLLPLPSRLGAGIQGGLERSRVGGRPLALRSAT